LICMVCTRIMMGLCVTSRATTDSSKRGRRNGLPRMCHSTVAESLHGPNNVRVCYCPLTTMLLGVGIDILSLPRFGVLLARRSPTTIAKRICSPTELKQFQSLFPPTHFAFENNENDKTLRYLSTRSVHSQYPSTITDKQMGT
jgi:hypothetical protein